MIAICVPSRGLVFSKTMESIVKGMRELGKLGVACELFMAHEMPIPDCHNFCIEQAFQNPAVDKIFFIEDDNFVFPDAFVALATSEYDIATVNYNDKNGFPNGIIHYNEQGEVIWCGLGATCIKREVFETLGTPYFRIDTRYKITKKHLDNGKIISEYEEIEPRTTWSDTENKMVEVKDPYKYGGLDIDFYTRARKAGYVINVLTDYKAHHFALVKLGEPYSNNGAHEIRQV
jgi:hypothetical protein